MWDRGRVFQAWNASTDWRQSTWEKWTQAEGLCSCWGSWGSHAGHALQPAQRFWHLNISEQGTPPDTAALLPREHDTSYTRILNTPWETPWHSASSGLGSEQHVVLSHFLHKVFFPCCFPVLLPYHLLFYFGCKTWCIQAHLQTCVTVLHGIQSCIWSSFHSWNEAVAPLSFILTSSVEQMSQPQLLEVFGPDSCKYSKATICAQNYN